MRVRERGEKGGRERGRRRRKGSWMDKGVKGKGRIRDLKGKGKEEVGRGG